jgi:wobble nucleotide-excising tRNase
MFWLAAILGIGAAALARLHNGDTAKKAEADAKETEKKIRDEERTKVKSELEAAAAAEKAKRERAELKRLRESERLNTMVALRGK